MVVLVVIKKRLSNRIVVISIMMMMMSMVILLKQQQQQPKQRQQLLYMSCWYVNSFQIIQQQQQHHHTRTQQARKQQQQQHYFSSHVSISTNSISINPIRLCNSRSSCCSNLNDSNNKKRITSFFRQQRYILNRNYMSTTVGGSTTDNNEISSEYDNTDNYTELKEQQQINMIDDKMIETSFSTSEIETNDFNIQEDTDNGIEYYRTDTSTSTSINTKTTDYRNIVLDKYDNSNDEYDYNNDPELEKSYYNRPSIQWYPGHIAKAERLLQETFFKSIDVVIEVRDGRCIDATTHPKVSLWSKSKPRIVVITHIDAIPNIAIKEWTQYLLSTTRKKVQQPTNNDSTTNNNQQIIYEQPVSIVFVNGQKGIGIHQLKREVLKAGMYVHEKLYKRGLNDRPLRVGIIGYPNVGKSTIINRLLGQHKIKKRAKVANTPGVTRTLQWIRIKSDDIISANTGSTTSSSSSSESLVSTLSTSSNYKNKVFDLLDSPGIIPASFVGEDKQQDAMILAACNCIGTGAYDNQMIASKLCQYILNALRPSSSSSTRTSTSNNNNNNNNYKSYLYAPEWRNKCIERYKFDPFTNKILEEEMLVLKTKTDPNDQNDQNNDTTTKRRRIRTGEDMVHDVAVLTCQGNLEDAARKILQDFRTGRMGLISLQMPPPTKSTTTSSSTVRSLDTTREQQQQQQQLINDTTFSQEQQQQIKQMSRIILETAKQRGLEIPETALSTTTTTTTTTTTPPPTPIQTITTATTTTSAVTPGKGLFEGW